jgi:hypothetical protein
MFLWDAIVQDRNKKDATMWLGEVKGRLTELKENCPEPVWKGFEEYEKHISGYVKKSDWINAGENIDMLIDDIENNVYHVSNFCQLEKEE